MENASRHGRRPGARPLPIFPGGTRCAWPLVLAAACGTLALLQAAVRAAPLGPLALAGLAAVTAQAEAADDLPGIKAEEKLGAGPAAPVYRFDVPLPITGKVVARRVDQVLRKLPLNAARPVFIFEFRPAADAAADSSAFGDALDLARYLSGEALARVRTVAWVRGPLKGHAVLPVLACEQLIVAKEAELGAAGIQEKSIDETLRKAYSEIAERRRTVPPAIALGLLDKNLAVSKVTLLQGKGVRFVTGAELQKLREEGVVSLEETLFQPGEHHGLSGAALRAGGIASHIADDRRQLAAALEVPVAALQQDLAPEEGWKPVRVNLHGPVHQQAINWIIRALEDHERRGDFNLLVLDINSGGGDLAQSHRLAAYLAALPKDIHTVAFVDRQARSDAALIALACHELLVHPEAVLGGPGESDRTPEELTTIRTALPEIYGPLARDWSLPLALVDSRVEVRRYVHSVGGDVRYLSAEEHATLPDAEQWKPDRPLETSRGITGLTAEELGLARATVQNFDQLKTLYQIEGELDQMRPNWALQFVEWLSDPRIAGVLLFIGWFALMFEMSTPGVGLPGFIAVLCFLLYFWSQFLHGTAGWLEVLLFAGGLACLAVEIFILPGFGIFGAGGALMVIVSIVLASQTFVLPTNAYQLRQFPISLLMVAAGMLGGIASIYVIRRFLPDTPYFNRMLLSPPRPEERAELSRREALVTWDHLLNQRGVTVTPLVPAGKAQFGDDLVDVISNGELIAKGTAVLVEEVAGNRVVVRKVSG